MKIRELISVIAIGCMLSAFACPAAEAEVPIDAETALSETVETEVLIESEPGLSETVDVAAGSGVVEEMVRDSAVEPDSEISVEEASSSVFLPKEESRFPSDEPLPETETSGDVSAFASSSDPIVDDERCRPVKFILPIIPENCVVQYTVSDDGLGSEWVRWTESGPKQAGDYTVKYLPFNKNYLVRGTAVFLLPDGSYYEDGIYPFWFRLDYDPVEVSIPEIEPPDSECKYGTLLIEIPELPLDVDEVRYTLTDNWGNGHIRWYVKGGSKQDVHPIPQLPYGTYRVTSELIGDNGGISQTGENSTTIEFNEKSIGVVYKVPLSLIVPPLARPEETEVVPATCVEPEYTVYYEDGIETMRLETAPARGHSWSGYETVEKATVFRNGSRRRLCSVCGEEEYGQIPKISAFAKISRASAVILKNRTLKLNVSYAEGDSVRAWTSSDPSVATVSNGVVKARKAGSATVTVSLKSGKKASSRIVVKNPTTKSLKVSAPGLRNGVVSLNVGRTIKLTVVKTPLDSVDGVKFASSSPKTASVSLSGSVKGLRKGTSRITVKSGKAKVVITVIVN